MIVNKSLKPTDTVKGSQFWRESKVASETGKYEGWWKLSVTERAWIIAVDETKA